MIFDRIARRFGACVGLPIFSLVLMLGLLPVAAPEPASATQSDTFTLRFVACAEGEGDATTPPATCDTPIDAPETAHIRLSPDNGMGVAEYATGEPGVYEVPVVGSENPVGLENFFSPDYNYFAFDGAENVTTWRAEASPGADITIRYWNGAEGLIMPAENLLSVGFFTCEEGIDPRVAADSCAPYAGDAVPDNMKVFNASHNDTGPLEPTIEGNVATYTGLPAYSQMIVMADPSAEYNSYWIDGDIEENLNTSTATAYLLRNDARTANVYLFNHQGPETVAEPGREEGSANLELTFRACPDGVDPSTNPDGCTAEVPAATLESAMLYDGGPFGAWNINQAEQDENGTFYAEVSGGLITVSGLQSEEYPNVYTDADYILNRAFGFYAAPGATRQATIYLHTGDTIAGSTQTTNQAPAATAPAPEQSDATVAPESGETDEQVGAVRVFLASCPEGLPAEGTTDGCEIVEDDGAGSVFINSESTPLNSYERDADGAYLVPVPGGSVALSGLEATDGWRLHGTADEIHGTNFLYTVEPGQTRDVIFYYTPEEGDDHQATPPAGTVREIVIR